MSLEKIINWNEVSEDTRVDLLERPTRVIREDQNEIIEKIFTTVTVSYTHLTLPTILLV